jgi:hypothetical protein
MCDMLSAVAVRVRVTVRSRLICKAAVVTSYALALAAVGENSVIPRDLIRDWVRLKSRRGSILPEA